MLFLILESYAKYDLSLVLEISLDLTGSPTERAQKYVLTIFQLFAVLGVPELEID